MSHHRFSSLRFRLLLLVLLAVLPALGLTLYTAARERSRASRAAQTEALRLARIAVSQHEHAIENTRRLLSVLGQLPEVRNRAGPACSRLFAAFWRRNQIFANLGVAGPDGTVFCSALPLSGVVNLADRSYVQRALATREFAIGDYQIGRITGKPTLNFGAPILDETGQVQNIVFAAVDLAWLHQLASEAQLPPGSTLTVIDHNGIILARYPDHERWVGQALPETPLAEALRAHRAEGAILTSGLDGVPRLYGFASLNGPAEGGGISIAVGIPAAIAYADSDRTLTRNLALLALVAVLALEAAWFGGHLFILRPTRALIRTAQRLSSGDVSARTELPHDEGELGQLARAFDEMAAVLQAREAERARAEERTRREASRAEALAHMAARLNARLDLDAVLSAICEETARALAVPAAELTWYDEGRNVFTLAATFGLPPDYRERVAPIPGAWCERLKQQVGSPLVIPDVQQVPEMPNADLYAALSVRTLVMASLVRDGALIGGLSLLTTGDARAFTDDDLSLLQALADQAAQAIVNARLYAESRRRFEHLQALRAIDQAITASLDVRVTLNVFLDQVTRQLRVDAAGVLLLDPQTQTLHYAAGRGLRTRALERTRLRLGEGHPGRAALERRRLHVPKLSEAADHFRRAPLLAGEDFVAYYAVPLVAKGQVKGVLELFHRAPLNPDREWLDLLDALAGQAAIAIDNATLFHDLQRSNAELALAYDTTLEGWSRALDLRDRETEGHTRRVTELTIRLARALGLRQEELVHVRRGALLHDIGKMAIPDSILLKPGPLDDEEWEIMRKHPVYAYELLAPITFLRPALDIPYCHHEKWDGSGYPRGLEGERIPFPARIFAVVDVWDALRSDRPYRPAWPEDEVLEYIRSLAGRHFDPRVVATFLAIARDGGDLPGPEAVPKVRRDSSHGRPL